MLEGSFLDEPSGGNHEEAPIGSNHRGIFFAHDAAL
jgi:hypothetical protein